MEHDPLRFPDLPKSELEHTITDLIAQAQRVLAAQGRLRALLQAYRIVIEELDLERVLTRIVEAAVSLVGAQYGALGVIDDSGLLERFIHVGIPSQEVGAIGRLPEGHGLLGAVIETAETIRLAHLHDDPRSVGFPEHHPAMDAFLGVPIRVRDRVFGNLYLTNPHAGTFSAEDEELIESLAATAGLAIENARLYDEARRRERLSAAQSEVRAALLSPDTDDVLGVVAERVASVVPVELVTVLVPEPSGTTMRISVARGSGAHDLQGVLVDSASTPAARAMRTGDLVTDKVWDVGRGAACLGPTAAVPLTASGASVGALCVSRGPGSEPFTGVELSAITDFAAQAGIAIALAWARRDRQHLEVIEDRSRIARDLHDHVIQRLFATGMRLQALADVVPDHLDEINGFVDEIDAAITDIRTAIFAVRGRGASTPAIRSRLLDVVTELASGIPTPPRITFAGPVDLIISGSLADDAVAVVRECLANVARHAHAQTATVAVLVTEADIDITVEDDGEGIDARAPRTGGTANLLQRAELRGGTFTLEPRPDGGTRARWQVPIPG